MNTLGIEAGGMPDGREESISQTQKRTARIACALLIAVVLSSLATGLEVVGSILGGGGAAGEIGFVTQAAYFVRETSYLGLALIGFGLLARGHGRIILIIGAAYIGVLLMKDAIQYGKLNWAPYGIRPLLILLSSPVIFFLHRGRFFPELGAVAWTIKAIIIVLVPVTIYQLMTLPSFWGETFFGPRTMGFWPNPIIYSMALAAFSLYLVSVRSRHIGFWIVLCGLLAVTTGGRAGLLALSMLAFVQLLRASGLKRLSKRNFPLLMLVGPVLSVALAVLLYWSFSSAGISGRVQTEDSRLSNERVSYVLGHVEDIVAKGPVNVLLGVRLGDGTNAVRMVDASGAISDNLALQILRSYGLIGLILVGVLLLQWFRHVSIDKIAIMMVIVSFGMAQSMLELHPVAILVLASAAIMKDSRRPFGSLKDA